MNAPNYGSGQEGFAAVTCENYVERCGGWLYYCDNAVLAGSRFRGNACGPTAGTGTIFGGSEQEEFNGGVTIGLGPMGGAGPGYAGFGIAYDGTNWRNRSGFYGGVIWVDPGTGLLNISGVSTSAQGTVVALGAGIQINGGGGVTVPNGLTLPAASSLTTGTTTAVTFGNANTVKLSSAATALPISGYGTPTGGANQGSFAAGTITLPNLAAGVAQLVNDLKSRGVLAT